MYTKKANLHIHTLASDGIFSVKKILREAKKREIDVIAITDHNVIKGSLKAYGLARRHDIIVIPGIEVLFGICGKYYEILAYFQTPRELKSFYKELLSSGEIIPTFTNANEICQMIKKYDGITVVPHLFSHKGLFKDGYKDGIYDGIEVTNTHKGTKHNRRSREFAGKSNFLHLGSGDVHIFMRTLDSCTLLKSESEITFDEVWANLNGIKKSIRFTPRDFQLPLFLQLIQSMVCGTLITLFFLKRFIPVYIHRVRYFKAAYQENS